ncbi:NADH dehydrogenase 1 alpha subcomplex assembly factor 3 [Obelidium mucronatum]|nr:NADH dehydrogenase 1 alpha subcomplex assembly factor 3 [Obelidium mucronatum]
MLARLAVRRRLFSTASAAPSAADTPLRNMLDAPSGAPLIAKVGAATVTINNVVHTGGVLVVNNTPLLWDAPQFTLGNAAGLGAAPAGANHGANHGVFQRWTTDAFRVFEVVSPTPEILVVGTGAQMQLMPQYLRNYLNSLGMQVEIMSTRHAASTYNLLVQEGRKVAAALLPAIPTSARTGLPLVTVQSGKRPEESQ